MNASGVRQQTGPQVLLIIRVQASFILSATERYPEATSINRDPQPVLDASAGIDAIGVAGCGAGSDASSAIGGRRCSAADVDVVTRNL